MVQRWWSTPARARHSQRGLTAAALAPVWALVFYHWRGALLIAAMSLLVICKHKANIRRLLAGTEPRIGKKS